MHLIISFADGHRAEAIVLAVSADRMRITMPEYEDAMELRLRDGAWMTEDQRPVELEALAAGGDLRALFAGMGPLSRTAVV